MLKIKKNLSELITWQNFVLFTFFIMFSLRLFYFANSYLAKTFNETIAQFLYIAAVILVFFNAKINKYLETKIIIVYLAWYFFISTINGLIPVPEFYELVFLTFVAFGIPLMLEEKKRKKVVRFIFAAFLTMYTILSAIAVYGVLVGKYFTVFPFSENAGKVGLVFFIGRELRAMIFEHSGFTAVYCGIAFFLAIYLFLCTKKIVPKVLCVISMVILHLCIAAANARVSLLAFACAVAAICFIVLIKKLKINKNIFKIFISLILSCIALVVTFYSFSFSSQILKTFAKPYDINYEEQNINNVNPDAEKPVELTDRDVGDGISTLWGRKPIWDASIKVLKDEPQTLIKGMVPNNDVMMIKLNNAANPDGTIEYYFGHVHSIYLYILLSLGIVGISLVGIFMFLFLKNSYTLLFKNLSKKSLPEIILPAAIIFVLVANLADMTILHSIKNINLPILMMMFGMVAVTAKDISVISKGK